MGSYSLHTASGKYIDKAYSLKSARSKAKEYLKKRRVGTSVLIDKNLGWITKGKTKMKEKFHSY